MTSNPPEFPSSHIEWDRLWQIVRTNPDDYLSWEHLIRVVESAEGGINASAPPENVTRLETVFDSFLTKFPLCFWYWKKYADWELAVHGDAGAEKIYERAVIAIRNSCELWNHYLDFKRAHSATNGEIESLFERGASCVGLDFLAHTFWDKYLDFAENRLANPQRVLQLLDRIVLIPMHQYARYYERWRAIRATLLPREALDPDTLSQFINEIRESKGDLPADKIDVYLREKMDSQTAEVYKKTQEGTNKRWVYEAEIKRPYFHVKSLDRPQLQNWNRYLDFEESMKDFARIRALYERCLVPCAQYEEFWLRYGQWLISTQRTSEAREAYGRAAFTFLPKDRCNIKIALALTFEEEGNNDEARRIYTSILETIPTHIETIQNYIHFERRTNPNAYEKLVNTYINSTQLSKAATAYFTIQYTRYLQQKGQNDKARQVFLTSSNLYPDSLFFWMNYINFELEFHDEGSEKRIVEVFEKAIKVLSKEASKDIRSRFREYLLERGHSIHLINKYHLPTSTEFISEIETPTSKRSAPEDGGYPFIKQPRFDTSTTTINPYGPAGGQVYNYGYNPQPQPQPPQPQIGYNRFFYEVAE